MKKNRRFAILAFLLIAVVAVGVGFANFTETLAINAQVGAPGADVDFENATFKVNGSDVEQDDNNHATIVDSNTLSIVITDAMINTGDEAVITVQIVNNSAFAVNLKTTTTKNLTNFSYESTLTDGQRTLAAGTALDVTITLTLTDVPDTATSQNFTITIVAEEIIE